MRYLIFLLFLSFVSLRAQSDHEQVVAAVNDYLEGTSYNRPDLLERAFHPEISMYFSKNNELWMPSREQYIGFFSKAEPGTFSGRKGNIRLVEVAGDVAMAKAEVLITRNGRLFIDYFLLKRHGGEWKIMSKTASNGPSNQHGDRILIVTSNADRYGDTDLPNANHFGEIVHAYDVFLRAGYTVDFASPEGGVVPVSYINTKDSVDNAYLSDPELWYRLQNTQNVADLSGQDYTGIYFPGGGAAMFGVADNPDVQRLTREVYEKDGMVGAVCHGTAGITSTRLSNGEALVANAEITGFPEALERKDKPYYETFPFSIEGRIRAAGGKFQAAEKLNAGYMVADGRIVTGMDHSTTAKVAGVMVKMLDKAREVTNR